MCGFCGIVHKDPEYQFEPSVLTAMRDVMTHRGPDDSGQYLSGGVALGSRRLAILDLSPRGHMPMASPDGRYWIAYNGEVYNFAELRAHLESKGHRFSSGGDTEVILRLFIDEGPQMLHRLNGMFAFAIWDSRTQTLFVARDRLGVKPVYYAVRSGALYFASEEKALFAAGIQPEFDPGCWEELLAFRYVAGERTPFAGVKRLLPGHYLTWTRGDLGIQRWWNLASRAEVLRGTIDDPAAWFRSTFESAVSLRRISDVPVGVLLSGGLDSSAVASTLAEQAGSGVASFTVRFDQEGYDEGPIAQAVADKWGLQYHELRVGSDRLLGLLRRASWLGDEPVAHGANLQLLAISEYAKPRVTVLLSGEGSDENLGGYVRYRPLRHPSLIRAASPFLPGLASALGLGGRLRKLARFMELGSIDRFVMYNACEVLPADLRAIGFHPEGDFPYREAILAEARRVFPNDPFRQAMYSDQHTFMVSLLDRNDRMTMGASIECRVPFLDYRIVEGLASLPTSALLAGSGNKPLLRRALGFRLPEAVLKHRKWGFGVPWSQYLREVPEFRALTESLPSVEPIANGPFDKKLLSSVIREFLAGKPGWDGLVLQLAMVAVWYDAALSDFVRLAADPVPQEIRS